MRGNQVTLRVSVNGNTVTEYNHQNLTFIEGRPGSDFKIHIQNLNHTRKMVVLSVDGLSVTDGQPAGETSPGYLLEPYQEITIPGWTLSQSQVAKFLFASRKESYANSSQGSDVNCGVIGLMVFSEKIKPLTTYRGMAIPKGLSDSNTLGGGFYGNVSLSASSPNIGGASAQGATTNNMGTGFGSAADFQTQNVEFEIGELLETVVMYYDDSKGLKARGIVLVNSSRLHYQTAPNPFPAANIGCKPPPGWRP